jgi:SAM-dependent methyltransferase
MISNTALLTDSIRSGTTQSCPICLKPAYLWCQARDHHYGNQGVWDVYRCSHCQHTFQCPVPKEEQLLHFYPDSYYAFQPPETDFVPSGLRRRGIWLDLYYRKYFRGYQHLRVSNNVILATLGYFLHRRPLHFDTPNFQPEGVLLDYGSGTGTTVAFANYLGWAAEGIELNSDAANAGQEAGIPIDHGSIQLLEERANRYNYILSSHCVEHVPEVRRLFRAFFEALKPGGILAIDVPNGISIAAERFKEFYYYLCMPVHVHIFTPSSMRLLAREAGFIDISTATYSTWYTQAEAAILKRQSQHRKTLYQRFDSHDKWERLTGKLNSLSTYLLSRMGDRGDCLIMNCRKPVS